MKIGAQMLAGVASFVVAAVVIAADLTVVSVVSPSVLVLGSRTTSAVTVHAQIKRSEVLANSVRLNGIPATSVFADARGELVAKFDIGQIKALVTPPEATLTLTAERTDGSEITGTDVVPVR